jgi:prepilin-type N-terminal cleavage/methylation domain-containing protein
MQSSTQISNARSRTSGSGFTLIEVLTVMLLAGLLAGAAIPAMRSLAGTRASAAQRQIQRDLSFARERAVSTGCRSWVVFSTVANTYSVLAEPAGTPGRAGAVVLNDPGTGKAYTVSIQAMAPGTSLVSAVFGAGAEVGFDWRGCPLNSAGTALSGSGVVTITGGRTVTVRPGTGHVMVP